MTIHYQDDTVTVHAGDCLDVLATLADNSVDSVVCDPPYDLTTGKRGGNGEASINLNSPAGRARIGTGGFMGKDWDATGIAFRPEVWIQCLRVLKPGGHVVAFGGSRTWHRLAAAIEDAGFEIRDSIAWLYGSGFPKSLDVSKAIDKAAGATREPSGAPSSLACEFVRRGEPCTGHAGETATSQAGLTIHALPTAPATDTAARWQGWGTALKPAFEPIVVGRKPIRGTVAANVVEHGTGALNIDACRVATTDSLGGGRVRPAVKSEGWDRPWNQDADAVAAARARSDQNIAHAESLGRWPTNVVLDEPTAADVDRDSGVTTSRRAELTSTPGGVYGKGKGLPSHTGEYGYDDSGGASRFFPTFKYEAKAPTLERPTAGGISHPTVKPLDLMRWLVRLVTPPHGTVLDPFAGSGTTAEAAVHEHMSAIVIEREPDYLPLIVARLSKPLAIGFDFGA